MSVDSEDFLMKFHFTKKYTNKPTRLTSNLTKL